MSRSGSTRLSLIRSSSELPNVSNEGDQTVEESASNAAIPRKRGRTMMTSIWNTKTPTYEIVFDSNGVPIYDMGGQMAKFMGFLVRRPNVVPIDVADWHEMADATKEQLWKDIALRYIIQPEREAFIKYKTIQHFGVLWRGYRSELRRAYYKPETMSKSQMINDPPKQVEVNQWARLVNYWMGDKFQKMSATNKVCRFAQKVTHTAGSKSFGRHAADMPKVNGRGPSRSKLWPKVHRRKDGTPMSDIAAEKIQALEDKMEAEPESQLAEDGEDIGWSPNDPFSEVFGKEKNGRVRGVGYGPLPSDKSGKSASGSRSTSGATTGPGQVQILTDRVASLEELVRKLIAAQSAVGTNEASVPVATTSTNISVNRLGDDNLSPTSNSGAAIGPASRI